MKYEDLTILVMPMPGNPCLSRLLFELVFMRVCGQGDF